MGNNSNNLPGNYGVGAYPGTIGTSCGSEEAFVDYFESMRKGRAVQVAEELFKGGKLKATTAAELLDIINTIAKLS